MADLQRCFYWLKYVFDYFTWKEREFNVSKQMWIKILLQEAFSGAIRFMLGFKMADLQLFSDLLICVFHYFPCKEWEFQCFQIYVKILSFMELIS